MLANPNDVDNQSLRHIFQAAVDAVAGDQAVQLALQDHQAEQVFLVAVGKAAGTMTQGAVQVLGDRLIDGLVISKYDHIDPELHARRRLKCLESAHPIPDHNSLQAGRCLQDYLRKLPASAELLFLTSGGSSSLVEALPVGMTLQDLMRVNQYLLGAGLSIGEMNFVRKSLSEIKGGRLALSLRNRKTTQLLISDVPGDVLEDIGSGLLVPPAPHREGPNIQLPEWLRSLQQLNCDPPSNENSVWSTVESRIVASNQIACETAVKYARSQGWVVCLEDGELTGDVVDMAAKIASVIKHPDSPAGVYIWGGETTVQLPDKPGRGGRNQQMAVQLAQNLADTADWQLLCCGTDGSDGPTSDAGGYFDDASFECAVQSGLDPERSLAAADCGTFLASANALVTTGPTGTNVMDMVIVRKT